MFHTSKRKKQRPVAYQLMAWLKYVGTEGSGASNLNQGNTFGIGSETADVYRKRVLAAMRNLSQQYIYWPNEEERRKIGLEIHKQYGFPHCVAITDGTIFPLAFEPETEDAPDYSRRKYGYSLTVLIFSDHTRKIEHYVARYPAGSAHDNRVFKASQIAKVPTDLCS